MKYINWSSSIECTGMNYAGGSVLFFRTAPGTDLNRKSADIVSYLREFFWLYQDSGALKEANFIPWYDFYFSKTSPVIPMNQYDFKLVAIFIDQFPRQGNGYTPPARLIETGYFLANDN